MKRRTSCPHCGVRIRSHLTAICARCGTRIVQTLRPVESDGWITVHATRVHRLAA